MYLSIRQQLKHLSSEDYINLRELCRIAKNLYNQGLYEVRQEYFKYNQYISYFNLIRRLQHTENYKLLQSQMSGSVLKAIDSNYKSFFALKRKGLNPRLPKYLDKDGFFTLGISYISIRNGIFTIPYSRTFKQTHNKIQIKVPSILLNKNIKYVYIIPKYNAKFFEIQYVYEIEDFKGKNDKVNNVLAIDFGINNLCTCVTTLGDSFIIDGKKLKSYNQWYNKQISRLSSIKDKQKYKGFTSQQNKIAKKRNNRVLDYIHKSSKYIINYCLEHNIDTIVCGVNKGFQQNSNLGAVTNQIFTQLPFYKLRNNLRYRCAIVGIRFVEQEESYTSKSSFWDKDPIPVYGDTNIPIFSGKRVKRGLYKTKDGKLLNADVNGALNILRKSNVVSLDTLYSRGTLNIPMRIRIC